MAFPVRENTEKKVCVKESSEIILGNVATVTSINEIGPNVYVCP